MTICHGSGKYDAQETSVAPEISSLEGCWLFSIKLPSLRCGTCPLLSHKGHHPCVYSVACRHLCSGLSLGTVEMAKTSHLVACALGKLSWATANYTPGL